jgi:hypothetical protein
LAASQTIGVKLRVKDLHILAFSEFIFVSDKMAALFSVAKVMEKSQGNLHD